MKTNTKSLMTLVAAVAMSAWLPVAVNAEPLGSARGGASQLMNRPSVVAEAPKVTVMACPKCKTEYAVKTDLSERGANKPAKLVGKHLCGMCSTELKTVGVGKHAVDVAMHVCKNCN